MIRTYHDRIAILLDTQTQISPNALRLLEAIWTKHTRRALYEESCLLSLTHYFGSARLEAACSLAHQHGLRHNARDVIKILTKGAPSHLLQTQPIISDPISHNNVESPKAREIAPEQRET
jgi:hypothetical protein